jgi:hypothetical protein
MNQRAITNSGCIDPHKAISTVAEVDAELLAWIKRAYESAG